MNNIKTMIEVATPSSGPTPQEELEAFRRLVRKIAIRTQDEEEWCAEGLNSVLAELGLEPYRGKVYFTGSARVTDQVVIPANRPAGFELTLRNVRDFVQPSSTDEDVTITGEPQVVSFEPNERGGIVTFEVSVLVTEALTEAPAVHWLLTGLELDYTTQLLLFDSPVVTDAKLTLVRDPDAPEDDD